LPARHSTDRRGRLLRGDVGWVRSASRPRGLSIRSWSANSNMPAGSGPLRTTPRPLPKRRDALSTICSTPPVSGRECACSTSPADQASSRQRRPSAGHTGIRFEEGDAEALPFADGSFDAVVSNFGVHHVPEPIRALREAHRVLRSGGRVAFTAWTAPPENIAWRLLYDAISAHGDLRAADAPPPGGGLRLPEDLLGLLDASGFTETEAKPARGEWRVATARDLLEGFRRGTVRTAALIDAQPAATLAQIEAAIADGIAPYRRANGFAVPIVAILGSGVRI